ncbi:hypothetical protein HY041_02880 [Candidatus Roizmanbacteria bacterium]|nr:hypothetical protein [Candidatus Roizmanbacteria bacterium]
MAKNLNRYYQAWHLRKQGKTLKEIGAIMGFSPERARVCANYIQFTLRKKNKDYKELKKIIAMPRKSS